MTVAATTAVPSDVITAPAPSGTSVADRVKAQLQRDYPPGALSWVDSLAWSPNPVRVPLDQIDRTAGDTDWSVAAANRAKVATMAKRISAGWRKPVVLIRRPGTRLLFAVDGHSRILACTAISQPVTAWVGTAKTATGPWMRTHARQLASNLEAIELVGPKGYIHNWIFVGAPGAGDEVFHPHHGPGTVTAAHDSHVAVRFDSGASHTFPVRRDQSLKAGHFERMTDDQVVAALGDGTGERFKLAMAELDRRDRLDREAKVRGLYQQQPTGKADQDKLYGSLVNAGENPEDAWNHAYHVDSETMQRQAAIAQLREQGYHGASFDAISRDAFKHEVQRQALAAESATNGFMLNKAGKAANVDPWSLLTGPEARARKYASPELREYWDMNGRPTVKAFQSHLLGKVSTSAPAGGDFYA